MKRWIESTFHLLRCLRRICIVSWLDFGSFFGRCSLAVRCSNIVERRRRQLLQKQDQGAIVWPKWSYNFSDALSLKDPRMMSGFFLFFLFFSNFMVGFDKYSFSITVDHGGQKILYWEDLWCWQSKKLLMMWRSFRVWSSIPEPACQQPVPQPACQPLASKEMWMSKNCEPERCFWTRDEPPSMDDSVRRNQGQHGWQLLLTCRLSSLCKAFSSDFDDVSNEKYTLKFHNIPSVLVSDLWFVFLLLLWIFHISAVVMLVARDTCDVYFIVFIR